MEYSIFGEKFFSLKTIKNIEELQQLEILLNLNDNVSVQKTYLKNQIITKKGDMVKLLNHFQVELVKKNKIKNFYTICIYYDDKKYIEKITISDFFGYVVVDYKEFENLNKAAKEICRILKTLLEVS